MKRQCITIRISKSLVERLKKRGARKGLSESALVCEALQNYLGESPASRSAYDLARQTGLIGRVDGGPADLSANRKYFKDFGGSR